MAFMTFMAYYTIIFLYDSFVAYYDIFNNIFMEYYHIVYDGFMAYPTIFSIALYNGFLMTYYTIFIRKFCMTLMAYHTTVVITFYHHIYILSVITTAIFLYLIDSADTVVYLFAALLLLTAACVAFFDCPFSINSNLTPDNIGLHFFPYL